jgi:hypothetical protein
MTIGEWPSGGDVSGRLPLDPAKLSMAKPGFFSRRRYHTALSPYFLELRAFTKSVTHPSSEFIPPAIFAGCVDKLDVQHPPQPTLLINNSTASIRLSSSSINLWTIAVCASALSQDRTSCIFLRLGAMSKANGREGFCFARRLLVFGSHTASRRHAHHQRNDTFAVERNILHFSMRTVARRKSQMQRAEPARQLQIIRTSRARPAVMLDPDAHQADLAARRIVGRAFDT